jgi:predicted nucleic acid-binding protein
MTAFDTNVLIYSCDKFDARRQRCAFDLLSATEDGVLLWQVAVEFVAASRKLAPQGFTSAHAWARLREFLAVLPLILPSSKVFDYAQNLHRDQGVSFWDALIIASCIDCGAETLYSEDLPGKVLDVRVNVVNPFLAGY